MTPINQHRLALWAVPLLLLLTISPPLAARVYTIVEFGDDQAVNGNCTLREAIRASNENATVDACGAGSSSSEDVILLLPGIYELDLANGTNEDDGLDGDLDILGDLRIEGAAADHTLITGSIGLSVERVFHISNASLKLRDLTVADGNALNDFGGLIYATGIVLARADVYLFDVVLKDGRAANGGAVAVGAEVIFEAERTVFQSSQVVGNGGGIANLGGVMEIADSIVETNKSQIAGGGIYNTGMLFVARTDIRGNETIADGSQGGGIYSSGSCGIIYTSIEDNRSEEGAGIWAGGNARCEVQHSALIDNIAADRGGAMFATGMATVRRSTVTGNRAVEGGGFYSTGMDLLLDHVTIAGNRSGGGVHNVSGAFTETSLLAANVGGNCVGPAAIDFGAFNLEDADTCGYVSTPEKPNFPSTDPRLGPLTDNGGPTRTFALLPGSPAIDVVTTDIQAGCENSPDQRGYPRGRPAQLASIPIYLCDIGAYEVVAPTRVNSTLDEPDEDNSDDLCRTASGVCTLRAAVEQTNRTTGLEEIEVPTGEYILGNESLQLFDAVLIRGAGMNATTISGSGSSRLFLVDFLQELGEPPLQTRTITDLTLASGVESAHGGAIYSTRPLDLRRVRLTQNESLMNGGAIYCIDDCLLNIDQSLVFSNSAEGSGGGIYQSGFNVATISNSVLSVNRASLGGAGEIQRLRMDNSVVQSNEALSSSGGLFADQAIITNSTVADNQANGDTGGLFMLSQSLLRNSIVARNTDGGLPSNCTINPNGLRSGGFNLSDTSECDLTDFSDLNDTDPLLAPAGSAAAGALQPNSPAIDAGDNVRCPARDVHGTLRPLDGDGDGDATCDIGAFEASGSLGDVIFRSGFESQVEN